MPEVKLDVECALLMGVFAVTNIVRLREAQRQRTGELRVAVL